MRGSTRWAGSPTADTLDARTYRITLAIRATPAVSHPHRCLRVPRTFERIRRPQGVPDAVRPRTARAQCAGASQCALGARPYALDGDVLPRDLRRPPEPPWPWCACGPRLRPATRHARLRVLRPRLHDQAHHTRCPACGDRPRRPSRGQFPRLRQEAVADRWPTCERPPVASPHRPRPACRLDRRARPGSHRQEPAGHFRPFAQSVRSGARSNPGSMPAREAAHLADIPQGHQFDACRRVVCGCSASRAGRTGAVVLWAPPWCRARTRDGTA